MHPSALQGWRKVRNRALLTYERNRTRIIATLIAGGVITAIGFIGLLWTALYFVQGVSTGWQTHDNGLLLATAGKSLAMALVSILFFLPGLTLIGVFRGIGR